MIELLSSLIERLEHELNNIVTIQREGDDDDDWENTQENYEIREDELSCQIRCLQSFEVFPLTYIGDDRAKLISQLITHLKSSGESKDEIKILEEILAVR